MNELLKRTCSFFYPRNTLDGSALFGSFPTQHQVVTLENAGVCWFIDLTSVNEKKITPYYLSSTSKYLRYSILDQSIPENIIEFAIFIHKLIYIISGLNSTQKIYIHCKGGHGRSGLVAAILLCIIDNISPDTAIREITISHNRRFLMKKKWKKIGSPQTTVQCNFLYSLFEIHDIDSDSLLTIFSPHKSYFVWLRFCNTVIEAIIYTLGLENVDKTDLLEEILNAKCNQHLECKTRLLETAFRPLESKFSNLKVAYVKLRNKYYNYLLINELEK